MRVYRIAKEKYIHDLTGTGARLYGGRWNPKGYGLLYTSEHKSLAALEVLVHLNRDTVPDDLQIFSLDVPMGEIQEYDQKRFEEILKRKDVNSTFKEEGKNWIESMSSLALKVPSVLISGEYNVLINPLHDAFKHLKIVSVEEFLFDERFFI